MEWFYVIIKFMVCIPYIRVLWNWMAHPKRMYNFECSYNKTKSTKCPCFLPIILTYVMFPHLHLLLYIHLGINFHSCNTCQVVFGKSIYFWGMVIVSDLEPLCGFQTQSIVSVFIQTGLYVESTVYLKLFLVSRPK
jgi:hypothetical protein